MSQQQFARIPPNVTSILQPIDQHVLRLLKLFYRKKLLSEILSNKTQNVANALKSVDLKQAITLLNESWIHVKPETIKNCWNKVLDIWDPEDEIPLSNSFQTNHVNEVESVVSETAQLLEAICPRVAYSISEVDAWNRDLVLDEETPCEISDTDDEEAESIS